MGITEKAVLYSRSRFSWKLSEIGAAKPDGARLLREAAATFGWLCVETPLPAHHSRLPQQPPSGGCVLKQSEDAGKTDTTLAATFGWLCVETATDVF